MKIKAAVLREFNQPLTIEELELADPQANEVLVRYEFTGFCHSDLHVFLGEIPVPLPMVLGHESAGVVEKIGPGVTKVKEGDRVTASWMVPCGKCFQCLRGHGNICEGNFEAFLGGNLLDQTKRLKDKDNVEIGHGFFVTGFSNYSVCPEDGVHKIPDELPLDEACYFGCCVPTGIGTAQNVANAGIGTSFAVYGVGAVGLYTIRGAALRDAYPIIAVDLEESKKDIAMEFGATHFIDSSKEDPVGKIQELTGGHGVEYCVEAIGDPGAIIQCWWSIRMGGSVILPGIPPAEHTTNLDLMLLPLHAKKIIGTLYGEIHPPVDIPRLSEMALRGELLTKKLTTKKIKIEDINEAADAMIKKKIIGRWQIVWD
ncbi:MAG: alcohol dehydrogenase catalytic domain-containing protein [Desulfobacteraceae bacterium]|jgi:S-(hydroxymethyl)glutathione dehydrogenase/alcohol dehydrogenase|nr:MAG: alcohol dehydrogenase catalytic domain-containing protein [Desulfobacteraceae bacterium]